MRTVAATANPYQTIAIATPAGTLQTEMRYVTELVGEVSSFPSISCPTGGYTPMVLAAWLITIALSGIILAMELTINGVLQRRD